MNNSVFFTDTDCEMLYTDAESLNMNVIGMPYTINNKEYVYDYGKNTDIDKFYADMRSGAIATTSALNTQNYIDYFEPVMKEGKDILYVHFSSELSGTFNHMNAALEELKVKYPESKVTCFDTKNICGGAGLLAIEACKLHNSGASDEEVVAFLTEMRDKIGIYFYVDSLQYLKRGGRISALSAVFGTMLNIKPILSVKGGKLDKLTTVKGVKKAVDFMVDRFAEEYNDNDKYEVWVMDADNKKIGDELAEKIRKLGRNISLRRLFIGPVIGAHGGPGTCGVTFFKK